MCGCVCACGIGASSHRLCRGQSARLNHWSYSSSLYLIPVDGVSGNELRKALRRGISLAWSVCLCFHQHFPRLNHLLASFFAGSARTDEGERGKGRETPPRRGKKYNSCFSWSVTRCRCAQICGYFLGRNTNPRVFYSGRRYQAYLFRQAKRTNVLSILWLAAPSISASLWSPRIRRCWILMSNPSTTSDNKARKTLQSEHRWLLFASVPFYASVWISATFASRECPAAGSDTGDIFTLATLWAVYVGTEGQAATTAPFKASRQSRTNWPHAERHSSGSVCSNNPLFFFTRVVLCTSQHLAGLWRGKSWFCLSFMLVKPNWRLQLLFVFWYSSPFLDLGPNSPDKLQSQIRTMWSQEPARDHLLVHCFVISRSQP